MDRLMHCIEERFVALVRRLAAGDDAPTAMQLRLEGLLEAAVITGATDERGLDELLERLHQREVGRSLGGNLGPDWRSAFAFPALPLFAARAPVSPSTGD